MTVQGDVGRDAQIADHECRIDAVERTQAELAERIQRVLDSLPRLDWPLRG